MTIINGTLSPSQKEFRFKNIATSSSSNQFHVAINLFSFGIGHSLIFENCKFLGGIKISPLLNMSDPSGYGIIGGINNNTNNNNNNTSPFLLDNFTTTTIQFINCQISCSSQTSCSGVNEEGMMFALYLELLPVQIYAASSSATNSMLLLPITQLPQINLILQNTQVSMLDLDSNFTDGMNIPAFGAVSVQAPSSNEFQLDHKKYQTTTYEKSKLGLNNTGQIPNVTIFYSTASSRNDNNNPPPHVSVSILQNSVLTCQSNDRPYPRVPRQLEPNAKSYYWNYPKIFACLSLAPSFATPIYGSKYPYSGWNSSLNAIDNFTYDLSYNHRKYDDDATTRGIQIEGKNVFSHLKFFVNKLEISGSSKIVTKCLLTADTENGIDDDSTDGMGCLGIFFSHVILNQVNITDSASLTTQGTYIVISFFVSEVHGGSLPWLKSNFSSSISNSNSTNQNNNSNNNTSNITSLVPSSSSASSVQIFVLPIHISKLLPKISVTGKVSLNLTQRGKPGGSELSTFCFVMMDVNIVLIDNVITHQSGENVLPKFLDVMYVSQTDEFTVSNFVWNSSQVKGSATLSAYYPPIFLLNLLNTRNFTVDGVRFFISANTSVIAAIAFIDVRNFWNIEVKNIYIKMKSALDYDCTAISLLHLDSGNSVFIHHVVFDFDSSSSTQLIYADDERHTNINTFSFENLDGTILAGKATNIVTMNITSNNVSALIIRHSNSKVKGGGEASCFPCTVMGYGPRTVLLDNITGTVECGLAGGIAFIALQKNPWNMIEVETVLMRNINLVTSGVLACSFLVALVSQYLGTASKPSYGYFTTDALIKPLVGTNTSIIVSNCYFKGTEQLSLGAAIASKDVSLKYVTFENSTFLPWTGVLFKPLSLLTMEADGKLTFLTLSKFGSAEWYFNAYSRYLPASIQQQQQINNNSGSCPTLGKNLLDNGEAIRKAISRKNIVNIIHRPCGATSTHEQTSSQTFYIPYKRTRTETNYSKTRTFTKSKSPSQTISLPFAGYSMKLPSSAQNLESAASISGLAGGAGATVALEAARALALLGLAQRCASFASADQRGLTPEELRQNFADAYMNSPIPFPSSLLPFLCIPPEKGSCLRGSIVADMLFLGLVFGGGLAHAMLSRKKALPTMSPVERMSVSVFEFARLPFLLGMAFAWRVGNWVTRAAFLFSAPNMQAADQFLATISLFLWILMVGYVFYIFWNHVNALKFKKKKKMNKEITDRKKNNNISNDENSNKKNKTNNNNNHKSGLSRRGSGNNNNNTKSNQIDDDLEEMLERGINSKKNNIKNNNDNHSSGGNKKFNSFANSRHNNNHDDDDDDQEEISLDEFFSPKKSNPYKKSNSSSKSLKINQSRSTTTNNSNNKKNDKNNRTNGKLSNSGKNSSVYEDPNLSSDEEDTNKDKKQTKRQEDDEDEDDYEIDLKDFWNKNKSNNNSNSKERKPEILEHWVVEEAMISFDSLTEKELQKLPKIARWIRAGTIFMLTSTVGKFLTLGDHVWSCEKINTRTGRIVASPTANGAQRMKLWQVGGLAIKYHGPFVLERVLERKKNLAEAREARRLRNVCTFAETSHMDNLVTRRYHFIDRRFRITPYYSFISLFWTFVACFAQGLALGNPANCVGALYVILSLNIAAFILDVYLRPFLVPFRNYALGFASFFLAIASVGGVFGKGPGTDLYDLAVALVYTALSINMLIGVLQSFLKISLFFCHGSVLLRRELWKKLQALLDDDLSAAELIHRAQLQARRSSGAAAHTMIPPDDLVTPLAFL